MKLKKYLGIIPFVLSYLIISLPVVFAQEINYQTDLNGNLVTGDSFYREYNEFNQLSRIRQGNLSNDTILEEYLWHPVEERILQKKVYFTNGTLKEKITYVNENYIVIKNQSGYYNETYVYQDGTLVSQIDPNGNKQAIHSDHEGSSSLVTDSGGNLVEATFYAPYGQIISGGSASRFDYEGKEFDALVNDYDFHFRKYNPQPPFYYQADSLIPNMFNSQSLNRYMFEDGNPLSQTDPTGHCPWCIAAGVGAVVGFGVYTITHQDNFDGKDAALYALGGAVSGALGVGSLIPSLAGGTSGQIITNYADDKKWNEGIGTSTLFSFFGFGLSETIYGYVGYNKIKYISSYFTTKTGQQFIAKTAAAEIVSQGNNLGSNLNSNPAKEVNPPASNLNSGGGSTQSLSGTNTLGRNSPRQAIVAAGGSTLSTAAQRQASETLAAKIIAKQRALAKKRNGGTK